MSRSLLNIEKRLLPRLMLSGVGLGEHGHYISQCAQGDTLDKNLQVRN
jgi:hypothetical protein